MTNYPVLREDGSVLTEPGYDLVTGLYLHWQGGPLAVPGNPTKDDAVRAAGELLDVVSDFPFAKAHHRSAWLAALLTLPAKPWINGPVPMFLTDGNIRGCGKGLLLEVIAQILTGCPFPMATFPVHDKYPAEAEAELSKTITSALLAGQRMILFDNLVGQIANATLDRALTAKWWVERLLGGNRQFNAPMDLVMFGSGDNGSLAGDTARRICRVRLETPHERPEERDGFEHPSLIRWVAEQRERLLSAALTILRAYHVADRPDYGLEPWGSFEAWSEVIRNAVVFAGLPDPGESRQKVAEEIDDTEAGLAILIDVLPAIDEKGNGLTAAAILKKTEDLFLPVEVREKLNEAIDLLVVKPDARKLGFKLRELKRRFVGGKCIDLAGSTKGVNRWGVFDETRLQPDSCASCPPSWV